MTSRNRKQQGFTLVEILIVVVILGILAAIVIPQFTSASDTAKSNSLLTQLQTIRSQFELYRVQHNDTYPTEAQLWTNLTDKTDASGDTDGDDNYGPYLQKAPVNPFESSSTVSDEAAAGVGWVYDEATGVIKAAVNVETARAVGLLASDETSSGDVISYAEEEE